MNDDTINRVFEILDNFNHWDILAEDYTREQLAEDLNNNPEPVIMALVEIIEEM